MVTCSTYYLHWTHGPHDREKYRFRKPHVHAGCSIEADCSIYSTCVSGKCVVFWPAPRSNITCSCLNDIINYEDHFYLKTVSSVQYHKGPTSNTCVVTYRWGSHQQSGPGSTVKEYEERDSGALLRREFISRNSASLIGLCKNTHANMSIPLTPQIQLKTQSKWYYSIRKFCKFDQYPWKDYGTYDKKLTFVFNPSDRSQGIGQGLIGLSFAMYLSLQSHRRLQLDWRQGVLFLEDWSTATSNWNPSHSHKTPQPIWNFGQTESASKMVQLLLSDEAEVVISGNSIKEKLPEFRKLFAHNIWESDDEAIRICRACAFPFLFDDDVDVNYENVLHLRLGDNVAYGFGSDRRKIMKLAHTIENAVDRGVKLLGSGDIFVESDSTRAKSYASKTYSNVQTKPSVGHTGTSSATLQDMKEMWQVILRMAAAKNVLYTQSALSEASVALGAAVLTNAMRFEDIFVKSDPRVLIFITTHMSKQHISFFKNCWSGLLKSSKLVKNADVIVYTSNVDNSFDVSNVFGDKVVIKTVNNHGYQQGAIGAVRDLVRYKWARGYDWVVRVNPDVIIRSDKWLLERMSMPKVHGIFDDCNDNPCKTSRCVKNVIMTDFFAVRSQYLLREYVEPIVPINNNAEWHATIYFKDIVEAGFDAWVPNTGPHHGSCRIGGKNSPVVHNHGYLNECIRETETSGQLTTKEDSTIKYF